MKVLVTGGGGFLGSGIVRRLAERGDEVRSFSRGAHPELEGLGVEHVRGDISDRAAVEAAAEGAELVFHTAAKPGISGRYELFHQANIAGAENVLAACRRHRIRRLVHTSSPSVVFDGADQEGIDESVPYALDYKAAYPRTKARAEQEVIAADGPDLATVALRPHLIWGPGDNHILPRLLAQGRAGRLRRLGNRPVKVDSTYIDNAVDAHILAAERLAVGSPTAGKAYFISNGEPMPLWDLVNRLLACGGVPPVVRTFPPRLAYALGAVFDFLWEAFEPESEPPITRFVAEELSTSHWFDLTAARRDLGYAPRVTIEEGLRRLRASLQAADPRTAA